MQKSQMAVGALYKVKRIRAQPVKLLAIGGYQEKRVPTDASREARIAVEPYGTPPSGPRYSGGRKPSNAHLGLRIDAPVTEAMKSYTEQDFLDGKPVPEGAFLIAVASSNVERPWEEHVKQTQASEEIRRKADQARRTRVLFTMPKVRDELDRLGISGRMSEYSHGVELTLDDFLSIAARIPDEGGTLTRLDVAEGKK